MVKDWSGNETENSKTIKKDQDQIYIFERAKKIKKKNTKQLYLW